MYRYIVVLLLLISFISSKNIKFSMVISGGISLGAYESGYNWAIINLLKKLEKNSDIKPQLSASAGASAGAINTLLSAIYWCQEDDSVKNSVDDNLFYNTWTKIDINELLIKGYDPNNNSTLFSREILDKKANEILKHLKKPIYKKGCSIPLGFMVTKARPVTEYFQGIPIKVQSFDIALKLYEKNGELFFKNIELKAPYRDFLHQIFIPKVEKNRDYIKKILFASSAFPMAFSQVELEYIYKGKKQKDWFLDGGLYNNILLDLSLALNPETNYFLFIDPDSKRVFNPDNLNSFICKRGAKEKISILRVSPKLKSISENLPESGFFENNLSPLFRSIPVFRSLNLYETINRYFRLHPEKKILLSSRYHPITGYFIGTFGAFLDENFREYDYYVGVYDAIYQLSKKALESGFANKSSLAEQMLEYKRWLNIDSSKSAKEAFELFMQSEFCQSLPEKKSRFSVIYKAFKVTQKFKKPFSIKAFSAFLKELKKNKEYLNIKENSFLANAFKYPDDWYKEPASNIVERVVVLENQRAREDESYEPIAKAVAFSAWLSSAHLSKKEGFSFQPLLPKNIKEKRKNIAYRLIPSEISIDAKNGGILFGLQLLLV